MTDDSLKRGSRGPAPAWKLGRTRSIRVPIVLADTLLEIARRLDEERSIETKVELTEDEAHQLGEFLGSCSLPIMKSKVNVACTKDASPLVKGRRS